MLIFKQQWRSPYPGTGAPAVAPIPPVFVLGSAGRYAIDRVPNVGLFPVVGSGAGIVAVGTVDGGLTLIATGNGRYAVVS